MEQKLNEEILRIKEVMGLTILNESIPPSLMKFAVNTSDNVFQTLKRTFGLSDDLARKYADDFANTKKLSDDAVEEISKNISVYTVDELYEVLKGSVFKVIDEKVGTLIDVRLGQNKTANEIYDEISDTLDKIPSLDGADEYKKRLLSDYDELLESKMKRRQTGAAREVDDVFDDLIEELNREGDSVEEQIDNIPNLTSVENSIMKRTWRTFWLKKESFYDVIRRKALLGGEETARLRRASDEMLEELSRAANNPHIKPKNPEAVSAYNKAMATTAFNSLPKWIRSVIISGLITEGKSISLAYSVLTIASGYVLFGIESAEEGLDQVKDVSKGGVGKLSKENESKIKGALSKLDSDLFKNADMGQLKDGYFINYAKDGNSLSVYNSEYNVIGTYTIDQINNKLKSN